LPAHPLKESGFVYQDFAPDADDGTTLKQAVPRYLALGGVARLRLENQVAQRGGGEGRVTLSKLVYRKYRRGCRKVWIGSCVLASSGLACVLRALGLHRRPFSAVADSLTMHI
jgi:hypothetical protein